MNDLTNIKIAGSGKGGGMPEFDEVVSLYPEVTDDEYSILEGTFSAKWEEYAIEQGCFDPDGDDDGLHASECLYGEASGFLFITDETVTTDAVEETGELAIVYWSTTVRLGEGRIAHIGVGGL